MRGLIKTSQTRAPILVHLNHAGTIKLSRKSLVVPMRRDHVFVREPGRRYYAAEGGSEKCRAVVGA
jgi:hypothetical protein